MGLGTIGISIKFLLCNITSSSFGKAMRIQDTITQNKFLGILTAFFHHCYDERTSTRKDNLYLDMRDLRVMLIFQEQNSYMYVL